MQLPHIGFGTSRVKGYAGAQLVTSALDMGYRLIDSAFNYENEGAVGTGIRRSSVPRDEVIVASKLPGRHHDYDAATLAIEESVLRTGLDHLDLYLIHWPNPRQEKYLEAWQALIDAQKRGLIKHIGVSNFLPKHIDRLEAETGVLPVVNQVELHPYFPQGELREYHEEKGIITEAWSPLFRTGVFSEAPVEQAASAHNCTPGQAVLAWHRAIGSLAIPKASSPERQRENLDSLSISLTPEEVAAITNLGKPDGRMKGQDPAVYEEF